MIALSLATLVILCTTLRAEPSQADRAAETAWSCLVCGEAGATDVLLNLLLFMPFGMALRTLGLSGSRALTAALALTIAIESAQATILPGRDASVGDLLANTLGAVAGWWLWPRLLCLRAPSRQQARGTALVIWLAASAIWLLSGWGLHPEGSSRGPWVGQLGRVWSGHMAYPGSIDSVALNGRDVPNDPLAEVPTLGRATEVGLAVTRRDATMPARPISLLRIVDGTGALQLSVAQRGEALLVSVRVRAARFRVRTPAWRHDDAMRTPADTPWVLEWRWDSAGVVLARGPSGSAPPVTHTALAPSVGLGWVFVHPFAAAIDQHALWWTTLWLALWTLPFAWCLRWLSRGEAAIGIVAALASFVGASLVSGMQVRWEEIVVIVMCMSVGAWLRRAVRGEG